MKTTEQKLLGVLLTHDLKESRLIVNKLSAEWFDIALNKKVFKAICGVLEGGGQPDLLSVVSWLRDRDMIEGRMISSISKLTDVDYTNSLALDNLINDLRAQYNKKNIVSFLNKSLVRVSEGTFTVDKFLTNMNSVKDLLEHKDVEIVDNSWTIEMVVEAHDKAKSGKVSGMDLGFASMHEQVLLEDVDVMVVGARPGVGKTAFGVTVACNKIMKDNLRVAYFALEMSREQMMRRVVSYFTEIDSNKIKFGKCIEKEIQTIKSLHQRKEINNLVIYEGAHTIQDIIRKVTELKHGDGCDLVIVDYLQKISSSKERRYDAVTDNSNSVKYMAQNLKTPVIALAQVKRDTDKLKKRPVLSDLKDSGDIEQDASIVAFLHRPEYFGESTNEDGESAKNYGEVIIAKNREGSIGIHKMNVDVKTSKWSNYSPQASTPKQEEQDDDLPF